MTDPAIIGLSPSQQRELASLLEVARPLAVGIYQATWAEARHAVENNDYWRLRLVCEQCYVLHGDETRGQGFKSDCVKTRRLIDRAWKILGLTNHLTNQSTNRREFDG